MIFPFPEKPMVRKDGHAYIIVFKMTSLRQVVACSPKQELPKEIDVAKGYNEIFN